MARSPEPVYSAHHTPAEEQKVPLGLLRDRENEVVVFWYVQIFPVCPSFPSCFPYISRQTSKGILSICN